MKRASQPVIREPAAGILRDCHTVRIFLRNLENRVVGRGEGARAMGEAEMGLLWIVEGLSGPLKGPGANKETGRLSSSPDPGEKGRLDNFLRGMAAVR